MTAFYDVVVVGGGATGTSLLRDLAMRGLRCLLVERGDLAAGTTGRYHGLLHSGGRYVVRDPPAARECIRENAVLRRIARHCVEDTGGLFVWLRGDPDDYPGQFVAGCRSAGIPVEEIPLGEARRREPLLSPEVERVFGVPDASLYPFELVAATARSAEAHGGRVRRYAELVGVGVEAGSVRSLTLRDHRTGEDEQIGVGLLASAAGAWAGQVAALAGVGLQMAPGWGTMVILNRRLTRTVVNRCRAPADGDIIVPVGLVSIVGTTDRTLEDPDHYEIPAPEVREILTAGAEMVPAVGEERVLRVYAGPRPLYDAAHPGALSRDLTRSHSVLDHAVDGLDNFVSIVGGKLTTCRLMAEECADLICRKLGNTAPCRTADEELPAAPSGRTYTSAGTRFEANEGRGGGDADMVCECELVTTEMVERFVDEFRRPRLEDLLRPLRLGMGPCQGAFCACRAANVLERRRPRRDASALRLAVEFLDERLKGTRPIMWGDQARQLALNETIYRDVFDLDHAPGAL
jgi:glycerol-3-phosphate dehydrogenase